jgi:hypothetical protein
LNEKGPGSPGPFFLRCRSPTGWRKRGGEPRRVLALPFLVLALASPSPHPTATNPFTLDPLPRASALPVIGATRTKPICSAIRKGVRPAVQSAMKNDAIYGGVRKLIYNYVTLESDQTRDLRLMQMDAKVQDLVKSTDALETALKDPSFVPASNAKAEDAKSLHDLHESLSGVLDAQKVQLDVLGGFVSTEQARRFGTLDENQLAMQKATAPAPDTSFPPLTGFLRDKQDVFSALKRPVPAGMSGARLLDRDLNDISTMTTRREAVATKTIVEAAATCR